VRNAINSAAQFELKRKVRFADLSGLNELTRPDIVNRGSRPDGSADTNRHLGTSLPLSSSAPIRKATENVWLRRKSFPWALKAHPVWA